MQGHHVGTIAEGLLGDRGDLHEQTIPRPRPRLGAGQGRHEFPLAAAARALTTGLLYRMSWWHQKSRTAQIPELGQAAETPTRGVVSKAV